MNRSTLGRLIATAACAIGASMLAPATSLASAPPGLSASSAILVAPGTGQELYGLQPNRERPIASTTKLMTALITLEHVHHLSRVFTQFGFVAPASDSQIGLAPGERMSVHDLLLALMLPSADDAAEDLAYNVGHGSIARFVGMMNAKARELGLRHTHYSTPVGLDTAGNYSTAADLVKLAAYDLSYSRYFARIVALPRAVLRSGAYVRNVVNRNVLVAEVPWINGVKTGHTAGAGYVLVASGHRHGMTLISAVLGTPSEHERDASTMTLLDYGFASFRSFTPVRAGEVLARPTVRYQSNLRPAVIAARTFTRVFPRRVRLTIRVQTRHELVGPLRRHAAVGTVVLLRDGRPVARIPLLLAQALPGVSGLTIAAQFVTRPVMLVIIVGLAVAAVLAAAVLWRRRTRASPGHLEAA